MALDFKYDVFVSYSSKDREWANRMVKGLERHGIHKVFLDARQLDKGVPWEPSLKEAVKASRHLVVLWSQSARDSDWVVQETTMFDIVAGETAPRGSRRLLCVLLDKTGNRTWDSLQVYGKLAETDAYATGAAALGAELAGAWDDIVGDIAGVVGRAGGETPIALALLAMTSAETARLDPAATLAGRVAPLAQAMAPLGLADLGQLAGRYGETRLDWRPFGGKQKVGELLDELLGKINQLIPGRAFRWRETDVLAPDIETARAEVAKLLGDLALIVIDPLSLYHPDFYPRFTLLQTCFEREQTVVMTLAPFTVPPALADLRNLVQGFSDPLLRFYFKPPVPFDRAYSTCYPHVCDLGEMEQAVRRRLGLYAYQTAPGATHPVLDPGRT